MHVDDGVSSFTSHQTIKVEIINGKGETWNIEVTGDLGIEKLKLMALANFNNDPLASVKCAHQFKLVSANKKKTLVEEASIRDEDVSDGDVILLLPKYAVTPKQEPESLQKELRSRGPNESEILEATSNIQPKNLDHRVHEQGTSLDFQRELRKILISLVDYAEKLLRNHPDVSPVLTEINSETFSQPKKEERDDINVDALKQLTDMGFATERAKRALKLNNMSPLEAMDWLLAYESSSSSSVPSQRDTSVQNSGINDNTGLFPKVPAIIECYRTFKRKHFKPNTKALNNIKQMGFDDNEVLDALGLHSNNEVAACEWLLSDRRPKFEDLQRGLKHESPIYKVVIQNPIVQLGLLKPRIFFAFLQLIEEPNSTGRWLSDTETSPVLSQIFRIYHSEKHSGDDSSSNEIKTIPDCQAARTVGSSTAV